MIESLPGYTHHIGYKAGASLLHSPRSAAALGRPLNTFVTLNLGQLGSTVETIFHDFARLRSEWFQRWSSYTPTKAPRNGPPTYAYVHENECGLPHTHWLVHIHPANRDRFAKRLEQWLVKFFNLPCLPEGAVQIKDAYNPEGAKLYMAKNLERRFAQLWKIESREGGPVARRRADTSRNLGPSFWKPQKAAYKARLRQPAAQTTPVVPAPEIAPSTPFSHRDGGLNGGTDFIPFDEHQQEHRLAGTVRRRTTPPYSYPERFSGIPTGAG